MKQAGGTQADRDSLAQLQTDMADALDRTLLILGNFGHRTPPTSGDFRAQRIYAAMVQCDREVLYANLDWLKMMAERVLSSINSIDDRPQQAPPHDDSKAAIAKLISRAKSVVNGMDEEGSPVYVSLEDLAIAVSQAEEALR